MTHTNDTLSLTRLYARLVVSDGPRAIDFYRTAFGAEEIERYTGPDGKIVHAMLRLGGAVIAVKDADDSDPAPTPWPRPCCGAGRAWCIRSPTSTTGSAAAVSPIRSAISG